MTEPAPLASTLRLVVHRLTRRLRAQRPTDGLSLTQLSALVTIWREGPLSAGDVAGREGVKPPSATRVIAALERQGLVARAAAPGDARRVRLSATSAGVARIEEDLRARDAWLSQQINELPAEEQQLLRRATEVLGRLASQ